MQRKYDIVLTFVMPNQQEVYAIWDIELYYQMKSNPNFLDFIMDGSKNGFGVDPIEVNASIYLNPQIMEVETPMGKEVVIIGKKIILLDSY